MKQQIISGSAWFKKTEGKFRLGSTLKYCIELTGKEKPSLCYIGTARGDSSEGIAEFYEACENEQVNASHLQLFHQPNVENIRDFLLSQDIIWVGWGSAANLLAVWQVHELDQIFREALEQGIILGGVSAGSICWYKGGATDSFGKILRPLANGLGFLNYSTCVHYDSEAQRRPLYHKLISDGVLSNGYATEDDVSLHFIDGKFHKAISEVPGKKAYFVYKDDEGIKEQLLQPALFE